MGSSLLLELNYKFINGSQLWTQPSLQGFSVAVPFLSIYFFCRNLTEYRKHLPMVNAMVIKDVSRDLSQSEMETLYYNKLELFLLWMFNFKSVVHLTYKRRIVNLQWLFVYVCVIQWGIFHAPISWQWIHSFNNNLPYSKTNLNLSGSVI